MTITATILDIIESNPDMTAEKIWQQSEAKRQTVKQTLWRLIASNKIKRRKLKLAAPQGPQSVYVYRIKDGTGTVCSNSRQA